MCKYDDDINSYGNIDDDYEVIKEIEVTAVCWVFKEIVVNQVGSLIVMI